MSEANYQLCARSVAFNEVIHQTQYTNGKGESFPIETGFAALLEACDETRKQLGSIYLIGNGGSAAVASHALTDFVNVGRMRAFVLHDSALLTCMANDFGYDQAFKRVVNTVFKKHDLLIAISSSGKSINICNAAKIARTLGGCVVTLSGFASDNPLRQLGDLNYWLDSKDYGLVEIGHLFLLHNLADRMGQWLGRQDSLQHAVAASDA